MTIQVGCTCGQQLAVNDKLAGRQTVCPDCGSVVVVPVPVWAPVQLEELPRLQAQPAYSSYTMPASHQAPAWLKYRSWILGGLALLVVGALVGGGVFGLYWLVTNFLEPPVELQRARAKTAGKSDAAAKRVHGGSTPGKPLSVVNHRVMWNGRDYGPTENGLMTEIEGHVWVNGKERFPTR
jgi:DNA-directed RNA polymerase subunit RPC12/RpoP